MFIAIIGTGNVATILGKLFYENGHVITSVSGRNLIECKKIADDLKSTALPLAAKVAPETEITIIALTDSAIKELSPEIFGSTIVLHTAGAVPMIVLERYSDNYGVFYPLQSLRKEMSKIPDIPFLLQANNLFTETILQKIAESCGMPAYFTGDDERLKMHASAVLVSNFTNYLYTVAEDFCVKENLDFSILFPLIEETATRITRASPATLQTGPAVRGDAETGSKHEKILQDLPGASALYTFLSRRVAERFKKD